MTDTIYAVATGARRAAICVIRISGPQAHAIVAALAGRVPPPRQAAFARLRDPTTGEVLDDALVLVFAAVKSEIGEDGAELHLHGSPAVVAAVLGVLAGLPGARAAEPGEFARRAFANGKMDLAQVEGLADLIEAETAWQRRAAQRQLSGVLRDATAPWRQALLTAAADAETAIDFVDEVDAGDVHGRICASIAPIRAQLRAELARGAGAERIRDGVRVVIAGPPNAGKSTLLNALVRREAAIVSAMAGTTRDPVEVHLDLAGYAVTLVDTAGLREGGDAIERIGMVRARERADAADLVLWLCQDAVAAPAFDAPVWRIAAKADLRPALPREDDALALSARTGHNLSLLIDRLTMFAREVAGSGAAGLIARARHRRAFETALTALDHLAADPALPVELVAEDLRVARLALERLIGAVDVEDLLGDIFSRFCIGK